MEHIVQQYYVHALYSTWYSTRHHSCRTRQNCMHNPRLNNTQTPTYWNQESWMNTDRIGQWRRFTAVPRDHSAVMQCPTVSIFFSANVCTPLGTSKLKAASLKGLLSHNGHLRDQHHCIGRGRRTNTSGMQSRCEGPRHERWVRWRMLVLAWVLVSWARRLHRTIHWRRCLLPKQKRWVVEQRSSHCKIRAYILETEWNMYVVLNDIVVSYQRTLSVMEQLHCIFDRVFRLDE